MRYSPQQLAFIKELREGSGSICLQAVAGSGKTSTLVAAVAELPSHLKITAAAFNKKIAVELAQRMPEHVVCKTMNALGHGAWMRVLQGRRVRLDTGKTFNICKKYWDSRVGMPAGVLRLVALAKSHGLVPAGAPRNPKTVLMEDTPESWGWLIDRFQVDLNDQEAEAIEGARRVLVDSIHAAFMGEIDFNDQLYMPVVYGAPFFKNDVVLVDECQDLSAIQRQMLRMMLKPGGRLIAVGDPHQAIYGFRGADAESVKNLVMEFNCLEMPLSVSFRCPKAVVAEAQNWVSHIEAAPEAPEGVVEHWSSYTAEAFTKDDVILCRNNKPLVSLAYKFIRAGVGVTVLGREIGQGLISLIKKQNAESVDDLVNKLDAYMIREIRKFEEQGKEDRAAAVEDKVGTIMVIIDHLPERSRSVPGLINTIEHLFADKSSRLTLSSIHKAKGLEWDRVFWLDANLVPSRYARLPWQIEQERNLGYVAVTRAKKTLVYITSSGFVDALPDGLTHEVLQSTEPCEDEPPPEENWAIAADLNGNPECV